VQPSIPLPEEVALELDALLEPVDPELVVAPLPVVEAAVVVALDAVVEASPPFPPPPLVNEKACPHPATTTLARAKVLRCTARFEGMPWFIESGAPA